MILEESSYRKRFEGLSGSGGPLEIFTDRDGEVILKKYSPMTDLSLFAQEYADSLFDATGCIALIVDDTEVVAVSGAPKKSLLEKRISEDAKEMLDLTSTFVTSTPNDKPVVEGLQFAAQVVARTRRRAVSGLVVLMSKSRGRWEHRDKAGGTAAHSWVSSSELDRSAGLSCAAAKAC